MSEGNINLIDFWRQIKVGDTYYEKDDKTPYEFLGIKKCKWAGMSGSCSECKGYAIVREVSSGVCLGITGHNYTSSVVKIVKKDIMQPMDDSMFKI